MQKIWIVTQRSCADRIMAAAVLEKHHTVGNRQHRIDTLLNQQDGDTAIAQRGNGLPDLFDH